MATPPPVVNNLPSAPNRNDAPADFSVKADTFVAALPPMVVQENTLATWMYTTSQEVAGYVTTAGNSANAASASAAAALASKNAAAQSAIDATNNGAAQVTLAVAAKNSAEAAAAAAQAAAGLPAIAGKPLWALRVNAAATGVEWAKFAGQEVGDTLITSRNPGASYLLANGSVRSQAAYPLLFSQIGLINTNNGIGWTAATPFASSTSINTIVPLQANGSFMALGNANTGGKAVYKTTDAGINWTDIAATYPNNVQITAAGYNRASKTVVAADTSGNLYRTLNDGTSWALVSSNLGAIGNAVASDEASTWLATAGNGRLLRSTDNGATWAQITWPGVATDARAICYCGSGRWIIAQTTNVYISTDNGLTFGTAIATGSAGAIFGIATDLLGTVVVVGNSAAIRRSADNGLTWAAAAGDLTGLSFRAVATDSGGTWVATDSGGAIRRSADNGSTWLAVAAGTTTANLLSVTTDKVGNWSAGGSGGVMIRNNPAYSYDKNTQFILPTMTAPLGLKAYIKVLEGA